MIVGSSSKIFLHWLMQAGGDFKSTALSESETDWVTVVLPAEKTNRGFVTTATTAVPNAHISPQRAKTLYLPANQSSSLPTMILDLKKEKEGKKKRKEKENKQNKTNKKPRPLGTRVSSMWYQNTSKKRKNGALFINY